MDFSAVNKSISTLEKSIKKISPLKSTEKVSVGIDLGTAYIVVVVLDSKKKPVACAMEFAQVIKDGLVVDYVGASRIVRRLVEKLEQALGRSLDYAATAIPPGTSIKDSATHKHVIESAGLEVVSILDEPTAANAVLGVSNGVIVDIGGGTTGLSVLQNGKVSYVADEPTGGTHLTLVLAGNYHVSLAEAEEIKKDPKRQKEILPVVRPVVEKMASIIKHHIRDKKISDIYLVGGTCCLSGIEEVLAKEIGISTHKPQNPFLVTPLGIALSYEAR